MVTLLLDSTRLEVALSPAERALAFRNEDVRIERTAIVKVQLTEDAWTWLRGVRSRGTHVPGVIAMGTWHAAGSRDFAIVRRGRPAVVIDVREHAEFDRIVLSTQHGVELVRALQRDDLDQAADVAQLAAEAAAPARPARRRAPKPAAAT